MFVGIGVGIGRNRFAQGIFNAYNLRVVADGGITEAGNCVDAVSSLLQSASLLLIPSGYKGGKLYAEIPTNGNGDLTWTRGSDAFRTNASGVIQRVPWNLFQYSEDLSNASNWFTISATVTTNTTTAPNGTLTADKLTATATTSTHILLQQPAGSVSGATSTVSIYAKSAGLSNIQFLNNAGGLGVANFNLSTGTAVLVNGVSASIENVGNGWYRCIMTYTPTTSGNYNVQIRLADSSGNTTFLGNGTDGVFLWGAQLVEGTTAQTYLPTTDRLNFPRLSYMYGSCPALLLEPQRTNLVLYSEQFNDAYWSKISTSITANDAVSPNGTNTADLFIFTGTGYATSPSSILVNGTTYTLSVYVRAKNTSGVVRLAQNTSVDTIVTSQNYSVDTNWQRISFTFTAGATSSKIAIAQRISGDTDYYYWGAQLELGAYATTIIPTTSATATRVGDQFVRSNIYTNGLITSSGGTWFLELRNNVAQITLGTYNFGLRVASPSAGFVWASTTNGRTALYNYGTGALMYTTTADTVKLAIKWNGTTADVFANGTKVVSAYSFTTTIMETLAIPNSLERTYFIQQMALFPTPLSDTDCQTLTTL